ncbi:hypothetical protein M3A96_08040 [Helcobacillus massiliensis]|uniref:DUF732 domain-containing protein n=1 Tax=Helcobacillus massiliensis TaxID=521392 RepID=A0A839QVR8_9MICO|nr:MULTISPECIES: hypothetical protein [Helcobacillus]MBB3023805.1 hypothetical protein [Helcobacillus massiliensis]MCG7427801.1 hypothetical protein [Helcobacillus sp. ACRRO]MCT1558063.1 hypothetical protein [Helcobacillus massiliensis]MCT2036638.1 hypothetical protein [Helcobacillus massiliensis]MCT2332488.1 hypothetical protein [Helcobacillus massiliensis]
MKTIRSTRARAASLAAIGVLALSLSGCGALGIGGDQDSDTDAKPTEESSAPAETTPEETTPEETTPEETTPEATTPEESTPEATTPAETTPAETTPAAPTTDDSSADPDKEPSTDEMAKGMEKMTAEAGYSREKFKESGISDEKIDNYFTCIVEESAPSLSPKLKRAIADGDSNAPLSPEEKKVLNSAIDTCVSKTIG